MSSIENIPSLAAYGFIGYGQMAKALIIGMISGKLCLPNQIIVSDPSIAVSIDPNQPRITTDNCEVARRCRVLVLAVKPAVVPFVCRQIAAALDVTQTLVLFIRIKKLIL